MTADFYKFSTEHILRQRHKHDYFEILYCAEGSGTLEVGDETIRFQKGDVMCIPSNVMHYDYSDALRMNCVVAVDKEDVPNFTQFRCYRDKEQDFFNLFQMGLRTQLMQMQNQEQMLSAICETLVQLLVSWGYSEQKRSRAVDHMVQYITAHFTEPALDLVREMEAIGYHPNYLRNRFHKEMGCSPVEYLRQCRINYARKLLHSAHMSSLPISTIAQMSGFEDPFYFSRVFKQQERMSPREYRLSTELRRPEELPPAEPTQRSR